ncbi:GGDEF domain-containing protein [Vallicoccus soli]|uniref:GGDEF domain-containing protein n=2 Tax=Vallicoccus soli TaxID=2339232 RepID=A0A3A3YU18_9ACTN|nr:GGDEF domain-containing protein [Vallicoccus soli]
MTTDVEFPDASDPSLVGRSFTVHARAVDGLVVCLYRETTDLREAQRLLREQALHDPLTGLPNRRLLRDRLQHALARRARHPGEVLLLWCDLDGFKRVNDEHGHAVGDRLLASVAQRLRAVVRPEDTVARLGGDEFVVLCEGPAGGLPPDVLVRRVERAVDGEHRVDGRTVRVGVSVGVAVATEEVPVDALLEEADRRMYEVKQRRR